MGNPVSKARPRTWNDDVRWLLERLLGAPASTSVGTESNDLPLGSPGSPVIHYHRGTHVDVGTAEETVLQLPTQTRQWEIVAVTYHRTGGSAAQYELRIGQAAGFADDGPDDRVAFSRRPVGQPVVVDLDPPVPVRADAQGRLYLRPGFSSGADNDATFQVWLRQAFETEESS